MSAFHIRPGRSEDQAAAYFVCLKTGDHGADGQPYYADDPDALGRIYVGPYLAFEPDLSLILHNENGVCGYALAAYDSRTFYDCYEQKWRPALCAQFPMPQGDPKHWTRVQSVYSLYHNPDYFCPEPYSQYPSHIHIDLLEHAQGCGFGRKMMEMIMSKLQRRKSPGAHVSVSTRNIPALGFYKKLGFQELARVGTPTGGCVYLGIKFDASR